MKKQIKILMLAIVLIMASVLPIYAADATATLKTSTEVKKSTEFTVILNVACEEGINGLSTKVSYDETKLELVKAEIVDTAKWVNMAGENLKYEIIHNSSDTDTSADIIKLTLKVKDTAEVGTKAKVTFADIELDSDAATNSSKQIGTKEVEISIVGEQQPDNGGENPPAEEPGTGDEGGDPPAEEPANNNGDGSSDKPYDDAGINTSVFILVSTVALLLVSFIGLKKYKNI